MSTGEFGRVPDKGSGEYRRRVRVSTGERVLVSTGEGSSKYRGKGSSK